MKRLAIYCGAATPPASSKRFQSLVSGVFQRAKSAAAAASAAEKGISLHR